MKPLQRWECTDNSCDFSFLTDDLTANAKHLSCPWCGSDAKSTAQQKTKDATQQEVVKMKCICGYDEEHVLGSTMKEAEPFKRVYISVHESQYRGVPVVDNFTVKMFACPKCGTVKIEGGLT